MRKTNSQHWLPGLMAMLIIMTAGVTLNWSGLVSPGMWWTDESRHAMHGAFFVDFINDFPIRDPYGYVQQYFAQYPALAFNWYLPLFPAFLGTLMSVGGVSEFTAHAGVIGVWLLGVMTWYAWLVNRIGRGTALAISLALLSMPVVVLWGRSVMLDAPAVAMCAVGVYFFLHYLDQPSHVRSALAGLALFTTLLVKQSTLFILPVLLIYALSSREGREALWKKEAWWGIVFVVLALVIIALHAIKFGPEAVMSGEARVQSNFPSLATIDRWAMYAKSLYLAAGPLLSAMAALGIFLAMYRREINIWLLPFVWLVASYVWTTYLTGVPGNNERYAIYAMPAVAFFAAYGLWHFHNRPVWQWGWAIALLAAIAWNFADAIREPHRYVSGYEEAARVVHRLPNTGTILFAGKHDGNFIFHMRNLDVDRQRVILRGDKTLVTMSVTKYFGVSSHVSDAADIRDLLNRLAVRWIVVESRDLVGLKEFRWLHELLRDPVYREVARIPVDTNISEFKAVEIIIYENLGLQLPTDGRVKIEYPYLGKTYEYSFERSTSH